jgi:hypothetical protein
MAGLKKIAISGVQTDRHSRLVVRYVACDYRIPGMGVRRDLISNEAKYPHTHAWHSECKLKFYVGLMPIISVIGTGMSQVPAT